MNRDFHAECDILSNEYRRLDNQQILFGANHRDRVAFLEAKIDWLSVVIDHLDHGADVEDAIVAAHNVFGDEPEWH